MPNFLKTTTKTSTTILFADGAKKTTTKVRTVYDLIAELAAIPIPSGTGGETNTAESGSTRPRPQDDFYSYANHAWLTDPTVVIPNEYSSWGSFMALRDESLKNQIELLKELEKASSLTVDESKLLAVWKASLKRFHDWAAGVGSYLPVDERLALIETHLSSNLDDGLATYLADSQESGVSGPFTINQMANYEDSENAVSTLRASGLSLPSRDYYFDENYKEKREFFVAHLNKVAKLIGEDRLVPDFAEAVLRFETKLATITLKRAQQRESTKYYTITTINDLVPNINSLKTLEEKQANYGPDSTPAVVTSEEQTRISKFMETLYGKLNLRENLRANFVKNYPETDTILAERIIVFDGDYFRRIYAILFDKSNAEDLHAYLQYKAIDAVSGFCTKELDEEFFDLYSRKFNGQKEQKSDDKRTADLINQWLGFLLGKVYVSRFFSLTDKARVSDMISEIAAVMDASIDRNDWLTSITKIAAKEKLGSFKNKIGFPDVWRSYDILTFEDSDTLLEMKKKTSVFNRRLHFWDKVNGPVDKEEWFMTPQTVNAYYSPLKTEICFPAAIIQPPFYAKSFDALTFEVDASDRALVGDDELIVAAANFGGIAAVIAHEITHGFDDQGRKYDNKGNVRDWWTEEDAALFQAKCDVMEKQKWSFIEPATGKTHWTQPKLTMGENLADLGGLSLGVQALLKRVDGKLSSDARKALTRFFFASWANVWKKKATDEFMVNQLATDPHSPGEVRANLVKNIDQFYDAFSVKKGDGMYLVPADRVVMW
ncbi:hypothetical protein HK100_008070 [Physocladia obscura]|uniref:Zincin n=1 Tax=Physocladia obscura TaxID=109957 RepID=A0AAD5XEQ8_9FUNG|nr:hypothetical protein HK100_008070 [Physocladia obscura]